MVKSFIDTGTRIDTYSYTIDTPGCHRFQPVDTGYRNCIFTIDTLQRLNADILWHLASCFSEFVTIYSTSQESIVNVGSAILRFSLNRV